MRPLAATNPQVFVKSCKPITPCCARQTRAQAQTEAMRAAVAAFKALGGGRRPEESAALASN
ncbi:protein of unknown function [Cupriavidus taiwanensis]|nr:protein of unknown function [Cupriavidus taiwanensis]